MVKAWLVIADDGFEAVFKDRTIAENYAVRCHGTVHPLVIKGPA
jgi:hypothetical protein